jgi:hypothetical protein
LAEETLTFDPSLIGRREPIGSFRVERARILAFAQATGDPPPEATADGRLRAPLTFLTTFGTGRYPRVRHSYTGVGFMAGQAYEPRLPIYEGDLIRAETQVKAIYEKTGRSGRMAFTVFETEYRNEAGDLVGVIRHTFGQRPK